MTLHASDEMSADGFSVYDVENALLGGAIQHRQRAVASGEWKYLVRGHALDGQVLTAVTKFAPNGKIVIITVFAGTAGRKA